MFSERHFLCGLNRILLVVVMMLLVGCRNEANHEKNQGPAFKALASEQKAPPKADVVVSDRFELPDDEFYDHPPDSDQISPRIAYSGSIYFVTYIDHVDSDVRVMGTRIASDGTVLDPAGLTLLSPAADDFLSSTMTLLFDGDNFLLVWSEERSGVEGIYAMRITGSGEVLDPEGFLICVTTSMYDYFSGPRAVFDGENYFAVWTDCTTGSCDIHGARFTPDAEILDTGGFVISAADAFQYQPAVGFNGTEYLVTWTDNRNFTTNSEDVYAARVTLDGVVLDTGGIQVSGATRAQWYPKVASDGEDFLVVWSDSRGTTPYSAAVARVSSGGVVLDPTGIEMPFPGEVRDTLLPVYMDGHYNLFQVRNGVSMLRIGTDGSLIDPQWITSVASSYYFYSSGVVFDGTNAFFVWSDKRYDSTDGTGYDVFGARIDADGVSLDGTGKLLVFKPNEQETPAAAFGAGRYLLAWADTRGDVHLSDNFRSIYAIRVSADGQPIDTESFPVNTRRTEKSVGSAVFDGTNFVVSWVEVENSVINIYAARISPDGVVLDPEGILSASSAYSIGIPASAAGEGEILTVFSKYMPYFYDIFGSRIDADGTLLDSSPFTVTSAYHNQIDPTVASGGDIFLAAWTDNRNASTGQYDDLYAARIGADGTVLDSAGILIDQRPVNDLYAASAYGQGVFLLSWEAEHKLIYAARVQPSGYLMDQPPIALTTTDIYSSVLQATFDGTNFILVWNRYDEDLPGHIYNLYGARVTAGGTVLDPDGFAVSPDSFREWETALASDSAGHTLIAYSADDSESGHPVNRIYYRFIDTTGAPPVTTTTTTTSTSTTTTTATTTTTIPADDDSTDDAADDSTDDSDDDSADDASDDVTDDSTDDASDDDSGADDTGAAAADGDDDDDGDAGCCG